VKIRAMVVDDEPLARDVLRMMLAEHDRVELVAECRGGLEAIEQIEKDPPDLLFLDVQMPEIDGFAVLETVGLEKVPILIFVTAYDRYALKAFEAHALDYLLKPFTKERLERTLHRAWMRWQQESSSHLQTELAAAMRQIRAGNPKASTRLVLRTGTKLIVLDQGEIDRVEAAGDYVEVHKGSQTYLVHQPLATMLARLDPDRFVRIHRSHIVNLERIRTLEPIFNGDYQLLLRDGTQLKLSRTYREPVLRRLGAADP